MKDSPVFFLSLFFFRFFFWISPAPGGGKERRHGLKTRTRTCGARAACVRVRLPVDMELRQERRVAAEGGGGGVWRRPFRKQPSAVGCGCHRMAPAAGGCMRGRRGGPAARGACGILFTAPRVHQRDDKHVRLVGDAAARVGLLRRRGQRSLRLCASVLLLCLLTAAGCAARMPRCPRLFLSRVLCRRRASLPASTLRLFHPPPPLLPLLPSFSITCCAPPQVTPLEITVKTTKITHAHTHTRCTAHCSSS